MNDQQEYVLNNLRGELNVLENKNAYLKDNARFWEQEYRDCARGALFPWMLLLCCCGIGIAIGWLVRTSLGDASFMGW